MNKGERVEVPGAPCIGCATPTSAPLGLFQVRPARRMETAMRAVFAVAEQHA
jgi:hypothetical protein